MTTTHTRRTPDHYRDMFEDTETVGRKILARGIYAVRHGTADDPDRDELATITRTLPDEPIPAGDALDYLEDEANE